MEEIEDTSSHVSVGFPLGLAILVTLMLFICCFFCCCLHWDKLQSLFPFSSSGVIVINPPPLLHAKPPLPLVMMKQNQSQSLPVLMPGDEVPKFIAIACPCQPPTDDEIRNIPTIQVHKAPPPPICFSNAT